MALINCISRRRYNVASAPTLGSCSSLCTQAKFPLKSAGTEASGHRHCTLPPLRYLGFSAREMWGLLGEYC